jgi:cytochrome P450/NADPH-cytochrome P450 reductase
LSIAITLKPGGFKIKVRRRPGRDPSSLGGIPSAPSAPTQSKPPATESGSTGGKSQLHDVKPITVLYGSQAGTCKTYAEEIETSASRYGFKATVQTLDNATEHVPKDQPVIIIAPSYEGQPADNAKKFATWLEFNASSKLLEGVNYGVFGVGNGDWANTFHKVPKRMDELFEKMGAKRFTDTGFVDVRYDVVGPWEEWLEKMWQDLREHSGTTADVVGSELATEITSPKFATHLGGPDIGYGTVKVNKDLGGKEVGLSKKHIEIELPLGTSYRSGESNGYTIVIRGTPLTFSHRRLLGDPPSE